MTTLLPFVLCLLSFTFYTTLASPPKLLPFHNHFDLTENITFPLTCSLLLESGQVSFQWTHNGVKLENSSDYRIDSSSPKFSFLTIPFVQRRHSGLYECRAVNNFGEADVTRTKINVQGNLCVSQCLRFAQNVALRRSFAVKIFCFCLYFSFWFLVVLLKLLLSTSSLR